MVPRSVIIMLLSMGVIWLMKPILGMVFILVIGISLLVVCYSTLKSLPYFKQGLQVYDAMNQVAKENLILLRMIRVYNREVYEVSKFSNGSQKMYEHFVKAEKKIVIANPIFTLANLFVCFLQLG